MIPTRRAHAPLLRRACAALMVLVLAVGVTACSPDGQTRRALEDIVDDAIAEAKERSRDRSGDTEAQPGADAPIGTDGRTTFDYAEYQDTVSATIGLLQQFWAQELPALGGTYRDPSAYTYYRSDEGPGPSCGQSEAPPKNAFYCPAGDFIAWDETGLMIPYYVGGGDFAAAFVLAHEFGHAMQTRLPRQESVGVLRELQADCFAGAWARWTAEQQLLEAGDLDEATLAVFTGRDLPGTPWTDPQAHGTGFERTRAFGDGFEGGAGTCYPAPAQEWIIAGP